MYRRVFVLLGLSLLVACQFPKSHESRRVAWLETTAAMGTNSDVVLADVDLDGHLDVTVARGAPHTEGNISVYYGPFRAALENALSADASWTSSGDEIYARARVGDLNSDGCPDVVVSRLSGSSCYGDSCSPDSLGGVDAFLGSRGSKGCARTLQYARLDDQTDQVAVVDIALADFDRDSRIDIALARGYRGSVVPFTKPMAPQILQNQSKSDSSLRFSEAWTAHGGVSAAFSVVASDFLGDGEVDLIVGGQGWIADATDGDAIIKRGWGTLYQGPLLGGSSFDEVHLSDYPGTVDGEGHDQFPHVIEIELMGDKAEVTAAVAFSSHFCGKCENRESARLGLFSPLAVLPPDVSAYGEVGHWASISVGGRWGVPYLVAARSSESADTTGPGSIMIYPINRKTGQLEASRPLDLGEVKPWAVAAVDHDSPGTESFSFDVVFIENSNHRGGPGRVGFLYVPQHLR